jgi:hypothetical protein
VAHAQPRERIEDLLADRPPASSAANLLLLQVNSWQYRRASGHRLHHFSDARPIRSCSSLYPRRHTKM